MRRLQGETLFTDLSYLDRRVVSDRRSRPTSFLGIFRLHGQRKSFRRTNEDRNQYLDCLSKRTVAMALLILVFSISDAVFTLLHVDTGAIELNPIIRFLLLSGVGGFFWVKSLGIGLAVTYLSIHQNFRVSWLALHGLTGIYGLLCAYHVALFFR